MYVYVYMSLVFMLLNSVMIILYSLLQCKCKRLTKQNRIDTDFDQPTGIFIIHTDITTFVSPGNGKWEIFMH